MPIERQDRLAALRDWRSRPAVRRSLRVIGLILLLAGVAWALRMLELSWHDLSPLPVVINVAILTPALLCTAAWSFQATARAAGTRIGVIGALRTVAHANVAELLPLPGGALVRGAALVDAGTGAKTATRLVVLTALLTLGLTIAVSSLALAMLAQAAWGLLSAVALVGVVTVLWILSSHATAGDLAAMVGLRLLLLALTAARILFAFAALGEAIPVLEAALYAVAPTLGATVGILPAGLGLNEAIAAGLAVLVAASPATAFLAVALNRVLGLVVGAVIVFASHLQRREAR